MGQWAVIAQFGRGEQYVTEVVARVSGTREDARQALAEAARWYRKPRREKRREVYRLPDGDSHLLILQGAVTRMEITLTLAELVYDSADPAADEAGGPVRPPVDRRPEQ
ncbi:hypothetical protein [Streptomyces showdoensis]|uniref:Uncharacterized protein n=1 Tax=Streptomyces showdoensis TaxID=68268 RepID=A0A2P2GF40_STREW|nr:hypothetical protein [Streptomyces showdoensis]KKZ70111.1 hypothetical protein VO63_30755 [Streptomyces showdoensis]